MVDIWIKKKSPRDRGRWLVFVRSLPTRGTYRAALLKLAGLGAALFHMAVATVPTESATSAPVRLLCSLAQYAVDMDGNIGKILGNQEKSQAIRGNPRNPAPPSVSGRRGARRDDKVRPVHPRRFPVPPSTPSHCRGRFFPSKSMYMNDMPLNLHLPYSVTTYPSRSRSGVIAITLYGVPLTSSPFASSFSTP